MQFFYFSSHFTSKDMSTLLVIQNQNSDGNSAEHLISKMHNKISIVIYRYQITEPWNRELTQLMPVGKIEQTSD